jgi:hypothetical protein
VAFAKLYETKHAITSADILNDRVLPFFEEYQIPLLRVLTDRGTEFKGKPEHHEYELYLRIEGIEHSKTRYVILKLTESANAYVVQCKTSSMPLHSAKSYTTA